ncbi:hypothetical protein ACCO45_007893 [Purpureocillium lilacinum]|uniref:Uncharacterized protein n=1 Tax=Purpureocillium lilacinum TaxID=33203 RepID=A0ACC4DLQ4_PURLI
MAPVNLDYQVPWTPQFALSSHRRTASRRASGSEPTIIPVSDTNGAYDNGGAVQSDMHAAVGSEQSSNKPPRISPDPNLSLHASDWRDRGPCIDLNVSDLDTTLPPLEQPIESASREQRKGESSHGELPRPRRLDRMKANEAAESKPVPRAGDVICEDRGSCQLTPSMEQACERGAIVDAKRATSPTNGVYHAFTTAAATPASELHTSHERYVSHDFERTSCPIDPALAICHLGEIGTWSEVPDAYHPNPRAYSSNRFGRHDLYGSELDGATEAPSLATATGGDCCQGGIAATGQLLPGYGVPGGGLPYFVTPGHTQEGLVPSDDAQPSAAAGQTKHVDHHNPEEHTHAIQPPRKRHKGGQPRELLSPPASISTENEPNHVSKVAEFEEWVLENALLKRILVNGVATFQLQFDWTLCATHGGSLEARTPKQAPPRANRSTPKVQKSGAQGKFTSDEDDSIVRLKERLQLPWAEIHRQHTEHYPGRSKVSLQVRYCTKLKERNRS